MIGIYKITNKNTGETYIGQATNIERRIQEHKQIRRQTIDSYINILGVDNFDFEILQECEESELDSLEQHYIEEYNSIENGYNLQIGGFNNSIGSGNGRAKLSDKDVVNIRKAYNNHEKPIEVYELYKHTGISYSSFQAVWQGSSWSHIMPEVYTEENKKFYKSGRVYRKEPFGVDDLIRYRQMYVSMKLSDVYDIFVVEHGNILKQQTFRKIITGDVKENSIYLSVPVYDKKRKKWIDRSKPVSTISKSGE